MNFQKIIACHDCDLVQKIPDGLQTGVARCVRCGAKLVSKKKNGIDRALAFALTGLILFILVNTFPFLAFKFESQVRETLLITGIKELYGQGMGALAILILITTILAPVFELACMVYVLFPLKIGRAPGNLPRAFRLAQSLQGWSMLDVFMLGILVSMVKLAKMAEVVPGVALYSFLAFIFVKAAMIASIDHDGIWEKWDEIRQKYTG